MAIEPRRRRADWRPGAGGAIGEQTRRLELHGHIGQRELDGLEVGDALAELAALGRGQVQRRGTPGRPRMPGRRCPPGRGRAPRRRRAAPAARRPGRARPARGSRRRSRSTVEAACTPSLLHRGPLVKPGRTRSTTKAVTRPRSAMGSVTAITTNTPASSPLVMYRFSPSRNKSPSRTAVIWMWAASEPASGSVRPNAPSRCPCATAAASVPSGRRCRGAPAGHRRASC